MMNSLKNIIQLDKRKGIVGIILAVLALVINCIWFEWSKGIAFAAIFLVTGYVKLNIKHTVLRYLSDFLWGLAAAIVIWYAAIEMVAATEHMTLYWDKMAINVLCVFILYGIVFLFTANWKVSVITAGSFLIALCTANGFVYQFRGKELGPMDILSFKTAMSVAGQYTAKVIPGMVYGWCRFAAVIFIRFLLPESVEFSKMRARLNMAIIEIIFLLTFSLSTEKIPIKTWDKQGTELNGYYLNFILGIRDSTAEKPENYTPETVEAYAQKYIAPSTSEAQSASPNIIVIMDESFADFRVLGGELRTNQPVTPFIDSLENNTIRGYTLASVFGGNTANSEYEFLTGHSMSFLPGSSVPYQQYINGKIATLPWLLDSYGYKSIATHPYFANGWSRNRIYPQLGFVESTFIDSYPSQKLIRGYISDQEMFEFVLQKLNDKKQGEPLFLFGITIQNHGGYSHEGDDFVKTIELEGYSKDYPQAEQYLTLTHETDAAMQYLLTELENYPEDTVVLFFGDHFPQVETEFFNELHGGYFKTLPEKMLQYKVPFFIWANYDIPEQTVECTSLNYLSKHLLEVAGLELSPYHRFMADLENAVPVMNSLGYYSISQNEFISYDEAEGEEAEWLNQYANLQYNNLFGFKNRNVTFFEQFITAAQAMQE